MFSLERGLGHMSISELTLNSKDEPVHRFEIFTGSGRRREWSDDQKAQIIAESCEPGVTVCSVARRHGLTPQQLFTWRRLARKPLEALAVAEEEPMFAPAVVVSPEKSEPKKVRQARLPRKACPEAAIELQIDGATLRIASGTDAATIVAVIQALKAQS
ncbi:transposase [Rhizobium leguminosarum]|uniref:IS66-like element accessory protein TnpA n=1 Tax=Rhizobium/Agrobacterium group TaxID=227290 RepID=UPI000CF98221|nr:MULTISPECIES: transposase [Rhizobium/Agrobacterium group]MBY3180053.1 transposase [Rhizobium leguminosarum]